MRPHDVQVHQISSLGIQYRKINTQFTNTLGNWIIANQITVARINRIDKLSIP